ncbi:MAG: hypothetical protein HWN65_01075 [Candidatus Helarchaeota archaeon]|nr:hypothetical protein [Candidatus Helarchaeota archaeon]
MVVSLSNNILINSTNSQTKSLDSSKPLIKSSSDSDLILSFNFKRDFLNLFYILKKNNPEMDIDSIINFVIKQIEINVVNQISNLNFNKKDIKRHIRKLKYLHRRSPKRGKPGIEIQINNNYHMLYLNKLSSLLKRIEKFNEIESDFDGNNFYTLTQDGFGKYSSDFLPEKMYPLEENTSDFYEPNKIRKTYDLEESDQLAHFNLLEIQKDLLFYNVFEKELDYGEIEEILNNGNKWIQFVNYYKNLDLSLNKIKENILNLENDWDGENSIGYKEETLDRTINFIKNISKKFWIDFKFIMEIPDIFPGTKGDIDIDWKLDTFQLLLTIPQDPNKPTAFYGDDYGINKIKGTFDIKKLDSVIVPWLKLFH